MMTTFTNISMMGTMVYSLYAKEAMIYITAFLLPYNILFFSLGYYWMRGHKQDSFFSLTTLRKIANLGIVACLFALGIYLFNIQIPRLISEPIHMLGAMTAPLSMLLIGSFLADMNWKQCLSDRQMWLYTIYKMLIVPLIVVLVKKPFIHNTVLLEVLLVAVATPAGASTPLLAQLLNPKAYKVSLEGATLTTLVAIISMPLVQFFVERMSY